MVTITDNGSSALAVDHAHFPSGEGGSWFVDHSYLVQNRSLSPVLQGESVCPTEVAKYSAIRLYRKGLHNFMHPRTDPVVITAILDETGDRILLGRNVRNLVSDRTLAHCRLPVPRIAEKVPWQYVMLFRKSFSGSVNHVIYRLLLHSSWLYRASRNI